MTFGDNSVRVVFTLIVVLLLESGCRSSNQRSSSLPIESDQELSALRSAQVILDSHSLDHGMISAEKNYFFTWNISGRRQIWKLNQPMSFPVQMTFGPEDSYLKGISPDGKMIFFVRELAQGPAFFWQPSSGGDATRVRTRPESRIDFVEVSVDSQYLFLLEHDSNSSRLLKYKIDAEEVVAEHMLVGNWSILDSFLGQRFLLKDEKSKNFFVFEFGKKPIAIDLKPKRDQVFDIRLSHIPDEFIVLAGTGRKNAIWFLRTKSKEPWTRMDLDAQIQIESFYVDSARRILGVNGRSSNGPRLDLYQLENGKILASRSFPDAAFLQVENASRFGRYISLKKIRTDGGTVQSVFDRASGENVQWFESSIPELTPQPLMSQYLKTFGAHILASKDCSLSRCPVVIGARDPSSDLGDQLALALAYNKIIYVAIPIAAVRCNARSSGCPVSGEFQLLRNEIKRSFTWFDDQQTPIHILEISNPEIWSPHLDSMLPLQSFIYSGARASMQAGREDLFLQDVRDIGRARQVAQAIRHIQRLTSGH